MNRFFKSFLVGLLAALLMGVKPHRSIGWRVQPMQIQQPVEQQTEGGATQPDPALWVVNNTGCIWDADDRYDFDGTGKLSPGEVATTETCLVADWQQHLLGLGAWAKGNSQFRLTVTVGGWTHTTVSQDAPKRAQSEALCMFSPDYDVGSELLQPIPDSGVGGVGLVYPVTFVIENIGSRNLRDVRIGGGVMLPQWNGWNTQHYCGVTWPWELGCEGYDPRVCRSQE
jgi:hypothetical protein